MNILNSCLTVLALIDTQAGGGIILLGMLGFDVWIYGLSFTPVYVCELGLLHGDSPVHACWFEVSVWLRARRARMHSS